MGKDVRNAAYYHIPVNELFLHITDYYRDSSTAFKQYCLLFYLYLNYKTFQLLGKSNSTRSNHLTLTESEKLIANQEKKRLKTFHKKYDRSEFVLN